MNEMKILSETEEMQVNGGCFEEIVKKLGEALRRYMNRPRYPRPNPNHSPSRNRPIWL